VRLNEAPFLVAAAVLHLGVPVAAHVAPPLPERVRNLLVASRLGPTEIAVEVVTDPFEWPEQDRADAFGRVEPWRVAHVDPAHRSTRRHHLPPPDSTSDPTVEPVDPVPDPEGFPPVDDYDLPPSAVDIPGVGTGPGGARLWLPGVLPDDRSPAAAPTRAQPRAPVDRDVGGKVVRDAMRAKDRTLGLDFPGASAIASTVAGAVRSADTPSSCQAVIVVSVGGNGRTQSVSLASHAGGAAGIWRRVVQSVKAQLASRTFVMKTGFEKGATVTVTVTSQLRSPAGEGSREGLGFSFDPSNIGARPTRVVSTTVGVSPVR